MQIRVQNVKIVTKLKNKKSYKASNVSSGESEPEELAAADREAMAIVEPSRCLFQI